MQLRSTNIHVANTTHSIVWISWKNITCYLFVYVLSHVFEIWVIETLTILVSVANIGLVFCDD